MLNLEQESISWCLMGSHNHQIQGNKYIYWFNIQSYMINTSMFYNKPINLTTIVMDYTINKYLKLFNNENCLTFVMQDYFGKTYEWVLRPSQSLSLGIRTDLDSHFSKKIRKEIRRILSCINWSQHI